MSCNDPRKHGDPPYELTGIVSVPTRMLAEDLDGTLRRGTFMVVEALHREAREVDLEFDLSTLEYVGRSVEDVTMTTGEWAGQTVSITTLRYRALANEPATTP